MNETKKVRSKQYDESFRREAVEHWRTSGKTAQQVADALGVST